jgi:superfamily I DNA/RNA helicase
VLLNPESRDVDGNRAEAALQLAELPYERLQPSAMRLDSKATLSTMHLAKGLEFRAVIVMACDEDVIPNAGLQPYWR